MITKANRLKRKNMPVSNPPTILVIVGITGDLARRKLLPAIERLAAAGELPEKFRIIGVTRRQSTPRDIIESLPGPSAYPFLGKCLEMLQLDLEQLDEYQRLGARLGAIEKDLGASAQRLFYLSVPPQASQPVIELLGQSGLSKGPGVKLLLEKPFGSDLVSAQDLFGHIARYFHEERVYHIDHYLAKEMSQNVLSFRAGNALFQHTWNKDFIERIEIVAAEHIGIEGRVTFYEQTGALRDFLQSHLMQLAALVLMELPKRPVDLQPNRFAALKALQPPAPDTLAQHIVRAQYQGYDQEVKNPHSTTETFASVTLFSDDERWQGVPITLTTGKGLKNKYTEIRLHYRPGTAEHANDLTLRFQPHESVELSIWSKRPGRSRELERTRLHCAYNPEGDALSEAHEQVVYDAIRSDHSLFTSTEEVLTSWRILAPVQAAWSMHARDLIVYPRGSTPEEILASADGIWRSPRALLP